jgi:hypothetical protein
MHFPVNFKLSLHFSWIHKNGLIAFWNQTLHVGPCMDSCWTKTIHVQKVVFSACIHAESQYTAIQSWLQRGFFGNIWLHYVGHMTPNKSGKISAFRVNWSHWFLDKKSYPKKFKSLVLPLMTFFVPKTLTCSMRVLLSWIREGKKTLISTHPS